LFFLASGATLFIQHQYTPRQAFVKALGANQNYRCPPRGKIIERYGLYVDEVRLKDGNCGYCDTAILGVWKVQAVSRLSKQAAGQVLQERGVLTEALAEDECEHRPE